MITKISEIEVNNIKDYLRITEISENEENYLSTILNISKDYIKNYTGLKDEELDRYSDLVAVVYILCQDLYDNRSLYIDNKNVNKVVETILGMHSRNLL